MSSDLQINRKDVYFAFQFLEDQARMLDIIFELSANVPSETISLQKFAVLRSLDSLEIS